ncbi:hypothetical protein G5B37_06300 [Rasiella rasia]|uniref:Uncharacterized protein n=1 Tax=Rasiella rasia TaxID=2744027 RepID=A0A6G6GL98_9FLAO|nr:hypothetical protein [Rasiella rasia]QIE59183.1 hypothetical protein G5B37_06300 [Rasiella rasia]
MKKVIILFSIAVFAFTFSAEAQNCNQGAKLAKAAWQKYGPWKPNITLNPFKASIRPLKNGWNWIASNGGANIGPRYLEIDGGNETGSITGQTKRTFITHPSFNNNVKLTINKYDGRAKTGVVICVQGKDGVTTQKTSYIFPNDRNGKDKVFNLRNVKGKIIIVSMKNQSVGNKFKYRIKAE